MMVNQKMVGTLLSGLLCGLWGCGTVTETVNTPERQVTCPDTAALQARAAGSAPQGFEIEGDLIGIDVVHREYELGANFILLDVRPTSDYALNHMDGALSMPYYDVEQCAASLPRDTWIVAYCSCPHHKSLHVVNVLKNMGFTKVLALTEGYIEWRDRGFDTHEGPL